MQTLESDYLLNQIKKYFVHMHRAVTYIFYYIRHLMNTLDIYVHLGMSLYSVCMPHVLKG